MPRAMGMHGSIGWEGVIVASKVCWLQVEIETHDLGDCWHEA